MADEYETDWIDPPQPEVLLESYQSITRRRAEDGNDSKAQYYDGDGDGVVDDPTLKWPAPPPPEGLDRLLDTTVVQGTESVDNFASIGWDINYSHRSGSLLGKSFTDNYRMTLGVVYLYDDNGYDWRVQNQSTLIAQWEAAHPEAYVIGFEWETYGETKDRNISWSFDAVTGNRLQEYDGDFEGLFGVASLIDYEPPIYSAGGDLKVGVMFPGRSNGDVLDPDNPPTPENNVLDGFTWSASQLLRDTTPPSSELIDSVDANADNSVDADIRDDLFDEQSIPIDVGLEPYEARVLFVWAALDSIGQVDTKYDGEMTATSDVVFKRTYMPPRYLIVYGLYDVEPPVSGPAVKWGVGRLEWGGVVAEEAGPPG